MASFKHPFTILCLIETKDANHDKAKNTPLDFLSAYKKYIDVTKPSPAIISRLKAHYRYS